MTCINCKDSHNEKFCPNCGQKSQVPKITFSSIFNEVFTTITNMDKGFLFNIKRLFLDPRKITINYVLGKRKGIFNPVSFLIVTISIYLLIDSLIEGIDMAIKQPFDLPRTDENKFYKFGARIGNFLYVYFKYFWLLTVVWLSISTKIVFRKYNFAEHLAINSFITGQATIVGLILLLIAKWSIIFNPFVYLFIMWQLYQIYKLEQKHLDTFLQVVAVIILFFAQLVLVILLIGAITTIIANG